MDSEANSSTIPLSSASETAQRHAFSLNVSIPLDIYLCITQWFHDARSIVRLSLCSKTLYRLLNDARSVWIQLLRRSALHHYCAPYSFSPSALDALSTATIRRMASHEARLEHYLRCQVSTGSDDVPAHLELTPSSAESRFELVVLEGEMIHAARLLPGGRWVYGEVEQADRHRAAVLWDLAKLPSLSESPRVLQPVARLASAHPQMGNAWPEDWETTLRFQYDPKEQVVNHLLSYIVVQKAQYDDEPEPAADASDDWEGDLDVTLEIIQLSWDTSGTPKFEHKAEHHMTRENDPLHDDFYECQGPTLDGDLVCVVNIDGAYIWAWKDDRFQHIADTNRGSGTLIRAGHYFNHRPLFCRDGSNSWDPNRHTIGRLMLERFEPQSEVLEVERVEAKYVHIPRRLSAIGIPARYPEQPPWLPGSDVDRPTLHCVAEWREGQIKPSGDLSNLTKKQKKGTKGYPISALARVCWDPAQNQAPVIHLLHNECGGELTATRDGIVLLKPTLHPTKKAGAAARALLQSKDGDAPALKARMWFFVPEELPSLRMPTQCVVKLPVDRAFMQKVELVGFDASSGIVLFVDAPRPREANSRRKENFRLRTNHRATCILSSY